MEIEHLGIMTKDIERLKNFYVRIFGGKCGEKYKNSSKSFESYFIEFSSGTRLEIMTIIKDNILVRQPLDYGIHHFCFHVSNNDEVDSYIKKVELYGCNIIEMPRYSGLGDYVGTFTDPDGNIIEILKKGK